MGTFNGVTNSYLINSDNIPPAIQKYSLYAIGREGQKKNEPALDLNFAENKSLVDDISGNNLITFSRTSIGTYVDSDGLIKNSPVNLLTYSEQFDQWTVGSASSVTPNVISAPDGTNTADRVQHVGIGSSWIRQDVLTVGTQYTASMYAKAVTPGTNDQFSIFYGSDGVVKTATSEWQRFTWTFTASDPSFYFNNGDDSFDTDIYQWGAQLEEGTTATDYIPTGATISGAPRFDHDPVTGESLGLLIEESRTNLFTNSLNVAFSNTAASNSWLVGISAPDGSNDARKCTTNNRAFIDYSAFGNANVLATYSVYLRADSTLIRTLKAMRRGSGTSLASKSITITEQWQKFDVSFTSTTDGVRIEIIDGILGIEAWGCQLELGSFPTSYIPTTGTTVTRAADIASIEGTNFSSWYNQSEGTWYGEVKKPYPTTQRLFEVGDSTTNQYSVSIRPSPTSTFFARYASGATTVNHSYPAKFAFADSVTDFQGCVNGTLSTLNSTGSSPTDNKLVIGGVITGTASDNSIARLTYWPRRLQDSTLQSLTS